MRHTETWCVGWEGSQVPLQMTVKRGLASSVQACYLHTDVESLTCCPCDRFKQYSLLTRSSSEVIGSSLDVLVAGVVICHQSFHNVIEVGHWNNRLNFTPDC